MMSQVRRSVRGLSSLIGMLYCAFEGVLLVQCYWNHGFGYSLARPLSRRLDRCDRMIQNESRDPNGGNVCLFSAA